jgi:hypothetical protein
MVKEIMLLITCITTYKVEQFGGVDETNLLRGGNSCVLSAFAFHHQFCFSFSAVLKVVILLWIMQPIQTICIHRNFNSTREFKWKCGWCFFVNNSYNVSMQLSFTRINHGQIMRSIINQFNIHNFWISLIIISVNIYSSFIDGIITERKISDHIYSEKFINSVHLYDFDYLLNRFRSFIIARGENNVNLSFHSTSSPMSWMKRNHQLSRINKIIPFSLTISFI